MMHDPSVSARLGGVQCSTSIWTSSTMVKCHASSCQRCYSPVINAVTIAAIVGTRRASFTFDAAVISSLSPANGAASGATLLTVTGLTFGGTSYTATASLQQSTQLFVCKTTSWTTTSSVRCSSSPDSGIQYSHTRGMALTVASTVSTAALLLTFDAPPISSAAPSNGPSILSASVTVTGLSFAFRDTTLSTRLAGVMGGGHCLTASWTSYNLAHVYTHAHAHVYTHAHAHVYTHANTTVYTHVCAHVCTLFYTQVI